MSRRYNPKRYMKAPMSIKIGNELATLEVYSYESNKAVFDVMEWQGALRYRTNEGVWAYSPSPAHNSILRHFNLGK